MLFKYTILDKDGKEQNGQINAYSKDVAISSLQGKDFIVVSIENAEKEGFFGKNLLVFGSGVSNKEIVILSKQLSTLFNAQISALRIFRLISGETKNKILRKSLQEITEDISNGSSVAKSLQKHPKIFSPFYVNMVASGEESGKLSKTFTYLSDYLDRNYEITTKVQNSLIYPSFVISAFFIVMYLMLTNVIPKISQILIDSGKEIPTFTKIVIAVSDFFVDYGIFLIFSLVALAFVFIQYLRSEAGKIFFSKFKTEIPLLGNIYKNLYFSRIAGNVGLMLESGVSMIKSLENTAKVVDNKIYEQILNEVTDDVRDGKSLAGSFQKHPENVPSLLINMIKVGEESGKLSEILLTMSKFYEREVVNAVDVIVTLIEPAIIISLGLGVGLLLSSVLIPIYNITGSV